MRYNSKENYCSSSPDVILGVNINRGCYLHDRHYRNERDVRFTRKKADQLLRDYIYKDLANSNQDFQIRSPREWKLKKYILFKSSSKILIQFRKNIAFPVSRIYYYTVRVFGEKHYV